jgi:hypothetical protein
MKVKKKEIAEAIRRHMSKCGAKEIPEILTLLRRNGVKISQPTLWRLLNGDYEGEPQSLKDVCKYSSIDVNKYYYDVDPTRSPRLMRALKDEWDGTPAREAFLARVIKAAGRMARA